MQRGHPASMSLLERPITLRETTLVHCVCDTFAPAQPRASLSSSAGASLWLKRRPRIQPGLARQNRTFFQCVHFTTCLLRLQNRADLRDRPRCGKCGLHAGAAGQKSQNTHRSHVLLV